MSSLKQGWETISFETCLEKIIYTKKIKRKEFLDNGKYPVVSQEKELVNGYWNNASDLFQIEKPIVIFGDHTKIIKFIDFNFVLGADGVKILQPNKNIDSRYLFYYLQNINLGDLGYARHYRLLKEINITYPKSLPEQQRIVAILDQAFSTINQAKTNAQQNLLNAKELFESYLQNVFENKGDDWVEKRLGEVTSKIGSGATPRGGKSSYKEEGISLIRSMNIHDFYFKEKNLAFIDEQQANALSNVTLQEEDVLLNITGASIARCCIVPKLYLPARVNQHVSIIRANKEIVNPVFLASLLTSKFFKDQILEIGEQGATRQAITKAQLENFLISFPKMIIEQENVIQSISILKAETKKLEAVYQDKINNLDELKKSILQKSFNGELVY
ncbi:restriction endonuclease subunit S [Candidatus Thioglobus sp.]|uniref:restriction endonuclease subunit S n=1 Tax=Candidatus Thioglobus sp. TaxID=2026721 RepID=UPI003D0E0EE9